MNRFDTLQNLLEADGWTIESLQLSSDCWWAKEIWKLSSRWSPEGASLYLSFLLDPDGDFDKNNPPDSAIWALNICNELPVTRPLSSIRATGHIVDVKRKILDMASWARDQCSL